MGSLSKAGSLGRTGQAIGRALEQGISIAGSRIGFQWSRSLPGWPPPVGGSMTGLEVEVGRLYLVTVPLGTRVIK
jgi:hypothetical protein